MVDPFDLVHRLFDAINHRNLDVLLACYQDDAIAEQIFPDDLAGTIRRGHVSVREGYASFFDRWEGALDGGAIFLPRTIGGIETGWGWVRAEWNAAIRAREGGGALRAFTGHSHFWVEGGLIQRHRTHASPVSVEALGATRREPGPRTYPSRPITGVGAVIFMDERVVLIRRRFEPLSGQWSLPGGTVELGETLEAAVAREVREETGLVVAVGPVVEVFDRILFDEQGQVRYHYVLIDYLCSPIAGRLAHGSDVDDVVLADPSDLEPYGLTPKAAGVIAKAARLR